MRQKFVSVWTIILLLSSYLQFFVGLAVPTVSAAESKQVLTNGPPITAKWQSSVQEDTIEWQISLDKAEEAQTLSRFKVKINQPTVGPVVYQNSATTSHHSLGPDQDNWLKEPEYTAKSKGIVVFKTATAVDTISISIQLDQQVTTQETDDEGETHDIMEEFSNVLSQSASGPHVLKTVVPIVEPPAESADATDEPDEPGETEQGQTDEELVEEQEKQEEIGDQLDEPSDQSDDSIVEEEKDDSDEIEDTQNIEDEEKQPEDKEETEETDELVFKDTPLALLNAAPLILPLAGIPTTTDPFQYTSDSIGTYPTHHTSHYTTSQSHLSIKNYNYGRVSPLSEGVSVLKSISGNGLTFESGYHDYDDALLKKIVIPTSDPNQFKIQLDMIGDVLKTNQPIDIALVLDRSSSMNNTVGGVVKWTALKNSVQIFANELLTSQNQDNIRLGLAGFGSYASGNSNIPYADIALMGTNNAFTSSPAAITSHNLYVSQPTGGATSGSGTPTYLGVDAGYSMLMTSAYGARPGATKVLIVLTDGLPTFGPNDNYYALTNNVLSLPRTSDAGSDRYSARRTAGNQTTNYFTGNGSSAQSAITITHANTRSASFPAVVKHSIGYDTSGDAISVLQAIGPNGYFTASNQQQLTDVLKQLEISLTATVQNGVVTDPMSDYVTLSGPVTSSALTLANNSLSVIPSGAPNYPSYASQIAVSTSGNQITLSNVSLGGAENSREGYRIEYLVTLKPEYRDGNFYPANKTTHLKNNKTSAPDYLHFAVPSIKGIPPVTTVKFKKVTENLTALPEVEFQIFRHNDLNNPIQTATSQANGQVTFTNLPSGQYVIKETNTPDGYQPATDIAITITMQADGSLAVSGLPDQATVVNRLYPFRLILYKQDGEDNPLKGAQFTLTGETLAQPLEASSNEDGVITFDSEQLRPGTYILTETVAPVGFELAPESPFTVVISQDQAVSIIDKDGNVVYTGTAEFNQESKRFVINGPSITNHLKDFTLKVLKQDDGQKPLTGATFVLTGPNDYEETIIGDDLSEFIFTGLRPGSYTLTETATPEGYIGISAPITIVIAPNGTVTIDGEAIEDVLTVEENLILLKVANQPKSPLPQTGGGGIIPFLTGGGLLVLFSGLYTASRNKGKGQKKSKKGQNWLMLLLVLGPLLTSVSGTVQAAGEDQASAFDETVTVVLHKLLFDSGTLPDRAFNDGSQNPFLKDYDGLNGATFSVYDVSEAFYQLRGQEPYRSMPTTEAVQTIQETLSHQEADDKEPILSQVTATVAGEKGIAIFDLPAKTANGLDRIYLFKETAFPEEVKAISEDFVLVLPVFTAAGAQLNTIHLYPKNEAEKPLDPIDSDLTKKVVGDRTDFAIGETITYKLTTVIPNDVGSYQTYTLSDKADPSLTLVNYSESGENAKAKQGIQIAVKDAEVSDFYDISIHNGQEFLITFDPTALKEHGGKTIVVSYQMQLLPLKHYDAADFSYQFPNVAILTPGPHPTLTAEAMVETGGKHFVKVDRQETGVVLAGAEFIIQDMKGQTLIYEEGSFDWVPPSNSAETIPHRVVLTSNNEGLFAISGLRFGSYRLVEIKAPDNYIVLTEPIDFDVSTYSGSNADKTRLRIVNTKKTSKAGWLPQTGEQTAADLTTIGIMLILCAGMVLFKTLIKRKTEVYPHDHREE